MTPLAPFTLAVTMSRMVHLPFSSFPSNTSACFGIVFESAVSPLANTTLLTLAPVPCKPSDVTTAFENSGEKEVPEILFPFLLGMGKLRRDNSLWKASATPFFFNATERKCVPLKDLSNFECAMFRILCARAVTLSFLLSYRKFLPPSRL